MSKQTKEEVKAHLIETVSKLGKEFENFPWEDANAYIHWLAQTYFYVRHTTCFLALSASRWGVKNRKAQYGALAHLREESSHDALILNDLEKMGVYIDHHSEWPEIQAFYQTQYYWIEHETPAAHLGYAYLLEGIASKQAGAAYSKIVNTHGESCGTFLRVHSEEDPHHFEEGLAKIDTFNEYELKSFVESLDQASFLYSQFLNRAKSKALGMNNFETIIPIHVQAEQRLQRIPEPSGITDDAQSVTEYNQVMNTNIAANYSICMDLIHRIRNEKSSKEALDLCSGPGHFAICLKKYLNYDKVTGLDLSLPMVDVANENSSQNHYTKDVKFHKANVMDLSQYKDRSFDLVSFANSAHHFEKIEDVQTVLQEAERVTREDGLIVLTDLGRLKSIEVTEAFVRFAGREFVEKQMNSMYRDFYNSMFAAWLPAELAQAIPTNTNRVWIHFVPKDFGCFQAIIGLPKNNKEIFNRPSLDWNASGLLKSEEARNDLWILQQAIYNANIHINNPGTRKKAA